jgi:DNA-binding MarR family transcriptional regulator
MSAMIDGLVGRALVERQSDPESRRRVLLFVTEQGVDLLHRYQSIMDSRHLAIIAGLDANQKARLRASARELLDQFDRLSAAPEDKRPEPTSKLP